MLESPKFYANLAGRHMTIQIIELDKQDSIFNQFIAEIRDQEIQKDSLRFRRNSALLERGTPRKLHVATAIGSEEGIRFACEHLPEGTTIWAGAIDPDLTPRAYIVPGLGDAGDLAYGSKKHES